MAIKLSICVPTYNRAPYLKECLDSIVAATRGMLGQIELVISDNESSDQTPEVCANYATEFVNFTYHRQEKNIGGERNFRAVASMARGEYVWVFGDDDKMTQDAVAEVLCRLAVGYDVLICNYSAWSKDFSSQKVALGLPFGSDRVFTNADEVMESFGLNLGFISSIVFRKPLFFILPASDYEAYVQYGFPFAYAVYAGLLQGATVSYIASPIVLNRTSNSGEGYDWYKYFVTGSSLIFDALRLRGYSKEAVEAAKRGVIRQYVIHDILVKKRDCQNTLPLWPLLFQHYKKKRLFWFGVVPSLSVPAVLVWSMWKFKRFLRGAARRL